MKVNYILLISLLIVGALFVPAVSAEELMLDNYINAVNDYSSSTGSYTMKASYLSIYNIQDFKGLNTIYFRASSLPSGVKTQLQTIPTYEKAVTLKVGTVIVGEGTANYNALWTDDHVTGYQSWIELDWFDPGTMTGTKTVSVTPESGTLFNDLTMHFNEIDSGTATSARPVIWTTSSIPNRIICGYYLYRIDAEWHNGVTADENLFSIRRNIDGKFYTSHLVIIEESGNVIGDSSLTDVNIFVMSPYNWTLTDPYGATYTGVYGENETPIDTTYYVTVYAQNANTGALINSVALGCKNYDTDEWTNSTITGGWTSVSLPAGNYEFYAEKSGYTQYSPGRLNVDGVDDNINLLLYPNVVAPPAGNLTLQFWVCDRDSNGIPYAELSVIGLAGEGADYDSGIIETNNLGYATLTAPGNSTYTAYASKPGYTSGENEFGVTTISPVHIAVMLMAGEIPTNPTPTQPGVTPTVTSTVRPTDVASGNNPIDNFRIMFLNMGFDNEYSDWLTGLFIVCIGAVIGYVLAKKFGAMCGAPIGLVSATGLGLIPIWALVLIIVIVALTYAKFIMGR